VGAVVTVSGIITADYNTTRTDLYVQDGTGGVSIFTFARSYNYQVGDSVTFTGSIVQFRGLIEISPDSAKTVIHGSGKPLPEPLLLTAEDVNLTFNKDDFSEPNEGRLVRVNGVTYNATNGTITDATGSTGTFIPNTWTAPTGTFDIIGILKQYKPGTPAPGAPFTADYEVVPRTEADIIVLAGPQMTGLPMETNIQPTSVNIAFGTTAPATAVVKYGSTKLYTDSVVVTAAATNFSIPITNLSSAAIYHYQVGIKDGSGANQTGDAMFSTGSPATSSGTINVYFSQSVDTTVSTGEKAQKVNMKDKLIARINTAQYSIDLALYSLSGTVGSEIASALLSARNRGVKIRMIAEQDNSTTAPMTTLKNSGIPYITDAFDPINAGNGLMHNKFVIFDYRDRSSASDDWVWTGSWNATESGTNSDAQNVVEIQDQSLAQVYTMEFDEMWGSSSDSPNAAASRFGIRKINNTPHRFSVKGIPIEVYFSPSDRTTSHIWDLLNSATYSINICMLTLTRDDLAQALISKKSAGDKVRVLLDNKTDTGTQFAVLQSGSVDVLTKGAALPGLLHHKYLLVDAEKPSADNIVLTGSHNWSNSAETSNNENTIVIHDKRIVNLYLQEFKSRYKEAGGTDNIAVSVFRLKTDLPATFNLEQNYPNPFNPTTRIRFSIPSTGNVRLEVFDILGRTINTLISETMYAGTYSMDWNAAGLPSGVYFMRLNAGSFETTKKLILNR
jgi:phosphatidylserine/phosphatidylglycerophosphate/cardiolipin synthase-like enzyme